MKKNTVRGLAVSAIMGVLGFVLMMMAFPMPFIIPGFIKMDFSELPALIASFAFGPQYGILTCLIKNLLHLPMTTTMGVGDLSNFLLGAVFTGIAGTVYRFKKNRAGALIGSLLGAVAMALFGILSNYFLVYPAYIGIAGFPKEVILSMYQAILPSTDSLLEALVIFNMPFTFAKGFFDSVLCFIVYKKISPILKNGFSKK